MWSTVQHLSKFKQEMLKTFIPGIHGKNLTDMISYLMKIIVLHKREGREIIKSNIMQASAATCVLTKL